MRTMPRDMSLQISKSSPTLMELLRWRLPPVDLPATRPIEGEPLKPLLAHVAPNGNFNVPVEKPISPQSEFIEELAAKAEAEKASFIGATEVARIEDGQITAINVTGSGSFTDPYVLSREEPDILAITRSVARSG
jgi:hypothetical protein